MEDRTEQMRNITRKQRVAIVGLFMVLLALTLCLIGATFIVWQAARQTSKAVYESDLYHKASYQLLLENFLVHEYILQPSTDGQRAFQVAHQQSLTLLHTIVEVGEADDIAAVKPIITEQDDYHTAAEHLFTLVNANKLTQASAFYNT